MGGRLPAVELQSGAKAQGEKSRGYFQSGHGWEGAGEAAEAAGAGLSCGQRGVRAAWSRSCGALPPPPPGSARRFA